MRSTRSIMLAVDSSTRTAGLALYDGSQVLSEIIWTSHNHHTLELAPSISDALERAELTYNDLSVLAVAKGPGSFTGLRIGMAVAKGISLARRIPIIAIPTLDFLAAAQLPQNLPLAAVLRAGRSRFATNWYTFREHRWLPDRKIEVLTLDELIQHLQNPVFLCGELSADDRLKISRACPQVEFASPARSIRRPTFLAELAWQEWQAGREDDPASLAPIYLHYNEPIPE